VDNRSHKIEISAATNRGRVRSRNEDAVVVGRWLGLGDTASHDAEYDLSEQGILLAVADGLGGHRAGEVASRFTIERLARFSDSLVGGKKTFSDVLVSIDAELSQQMVENSSLRGMGSTIVAALVSKETLTIANVGDSRAYVSDKLGGVRQITVDDVPQFSSESTDLNAPHFSGTRRMTSAITQALGGSSSRKRTLIPHLVTLPAKSDGWTLLLCSDGLSDFVEERHLYDALMSSELNAEHLVESALGSGGEDNISVILARYTPL
jgi:protein phosphatase